MSGRKIPFSYFSSFYEKYDFCISKYNMHNSELVLTKMVPSHTFNNFPLHFEAPFGYVKQTDRIQIKRKASFETSSLIISTTLCTASSKHNINVFFSNIYLGHEAGRQIQIEVCFGTSSRIYPQLCIQLYASITKAQNQHVL